MNFLKRNKDTGFYLVEWKTGYIQVWEDWSQYFNSKKYNWLNFRPIWFEIDYDKLAGEQLTIEFGLLGFNSRIYQYIKDNKNGERLKKETKKLMSLQENHQKEVWKLKLQIKKLKQELNGRNK